MNFVLPSGVEEHENRNMFSDPISKTYVDLTLASTA